MSTRSCIVIKRNNGTYESIYCHYDGYPWGGVGETLYRSYNNIASINALMKLGDLSALGDKPISDPEDWNPEKLFNSTVRCLVYNDRGEQTHSEKQYSEKDFNKYIEEGPWEFIYLYVEDDSTWYVSQIREPSYFNRLDKVLDKEIDFED